MATNRIAVGQSSPSTEFFLDADWVEQSQGGNWSKMDIALTAINKGTTGSGFFGWGKQTAHANGYVFERNGNPFLPSGYGYNAERWKVWGSKIFYHDGNGFLYDVGLAMELQYGGVNGIWYGSIPAPGRIPKPPAAPDWISNTFASPTSLRVDWGGSPDHRGAAPDRARAIWYAFDAGGNPYVHWVDEWNGAYSQANNLDPARTYHVYASWHNVAGWGDQRGIALQTLSGAYVSDGNSWRPAAVYESDGSNWLNRIVQVSNGTAWQNAL